MYKIHRMDKHARLAALDLNLLVVFDALLKDHNVTSAARRVGLSQPAMSSALGRLRRTFNDPLFVRTGAGMQPTPYAQMLAAPIQRACELVADSLEMGASFDPASADRNFQFYMTDIGEAVFLPKLLNALAQRAPRVTVKVLRIPEHGGPALAAGDVDLALGFFPDLKAGFYQQRLYIDEFVCVLRADHPQARAQLTLKQFAAIPHAIVSTVGTGHEPAIARALARHRIKPALTIPHFMAVPVIVGQTDHVAIVPGRLGRVFAQYPGLRVLPSPLRVPSFEIKQHWHERYHLDPANRWLRALVAELFLST